MIISNIKISCQIQLTEHACLTLNNEVKCKQFNNFVVIKSKYVYTIFKRKKNSQSYHVNITKIPSEKFIQSSMDELHKILQSPFLIKSYKKENITCTYDVGKKMPLILIYEKLREEKFVEKVKFNPERFPGMFIFTPNNTILLFSSGKMVIIGANKIKSVVDSIQSLLLFVDTYIFNHS